MLRRIFLILLGLLTALLLAGLYLVSTIYYISSLDEAQQADAIVVLGAAQYNGIPSPVLQARLNHARALFEKKLAPIIITTGGKLEKDTFSEAQAGQKYLMENGIPEKAIVMEEDSLTTKQNLARVAEIAREQDFKKVILVSDPFHMYRAKLLAEDAGLTVFTSPTRTSPISKNRREELSYILREMGSIIFDRFFDF